jgi:hypothetical protein
MKPEIWLPSMPPSLLTPQSPHAASCFLYPKLTG